MDHILTVKNLTKTYQLYAGPIDRLREAVRRTPRHTASFALDGVSFAVSPGETVGIIGRNGSGKSTLLRILAGIVTQTSGAAEVVGRVAALIELGAGFHPEYTGIENVYLSGTLSGFSRAETAARLDGILKFAEIGDYAAQPVKTYSSGMFVRLAFAVAASLDPDVLLIDEALAVGDYRFQAKCYRRLEELKQQGTTILFVSHDADAVRRLCSRAVWLDEGRLRMDGDVREVTAKYMEYCIEGERVAGVSSGGAINRFGSRPGCIRKVEVSPAAAVVGETVEISVWFEIPAEASLETLGVSAAVKNKYGLDLAVLATYPDGIRFEKPGPAQAVFRFTNIFGAGEYTLAAGVEDRGGRPISYYDYVEGAAYWRSVASREEFGLVVLPSEVEVDYEA